MNITTNSWLDTVIGNKCLHTFFFNYKGLLTKAKLYFPITIYIIELKIDYGNNRIPDPFSQSWVSDYLTEEIPCVCPVQLPAVHETPLDLTGTQPESSNIKKPFIKGGDSSQNICITLPTEQEAYRKF